MRLNEPLNGIKIGVGHNLIHLAFLITMLTVNQDITLNLNYNAKAPKEPKAAYGYGADPYGAKVEVDPYAVKPKAGYRLLAATAEAVYDKPDPMSIKIHELFLFKVLIAAHVCCFVI
jgi:hypothetical protein